jgi:Fe-S-cluster-containing dehydrogenase component
MAQWHLVIDVERCEDCNNCFLACKDEHVGNDWPGYAAAQPRHGQRWIDVLRKERGSYPLVEAVYLPVPCMHCDDAPCVAAGEGTVRKRADGIVLIDPERTQGRRDLVASCPYGAMWWDQESGLPQKCTLCAHLLDQGWRDTRCTQVCPTGALRLVDTSDEEWEVMGRTMGLEPLRPDHGTSPRVLYRNLARWDSALVCGTVTVERDGVLECGAGATVGLRAAASAESQTTTTSDTFGDFRFDGVEQGSGAYSLTVSLDGYAEAEREIEMGGSLNVGTIHLGERSA